VVTSSGHPIMTGMCTVVSLRPCTFINFMTEERAPWGYTRKV